MITQPGLADYITVLVVGGAAFAWMSWRLWGRRWWIKTTRCSNDRHEWIKPQFFYASNDLMAELGAAITWATSPERVCAWCKTPRLGLTAPKDELVQVVGDWGQAVVEESYDEAWLSTIGASWQW